MTKETTNQLLNETCFNPTEANQRAHLARVTVKIDDALQHLSPEVAARHREMIKLKAFLHEHKGDMDHVEKISVRQAVDPIVMTGKHGEAQRKRLVKLFHSPYFGRVDLRNGHTHAQPVNIGIHSFHEKLGGEPLIHDWRAPVSSWFYDSETGDAYSHTPEGRVDCRLERNRQFKVEKGQRVFMLETSLNITELTQRINRNPNLEPIERHGENPEISACSNAALELEQIRGAVKDFLASNHHSLGILCTTQEQADALHEQIRDVTDRIRLLNARSTVFSGGVVVAPAHLAKGLEFDRVIVPHCTAENYRNVIDRHMLYVACTRAMHRLHLTHVGPRTPLLETAVD